MRSMTGFGKAEVKLADGVYCIEVSAVNNRYLEYSFRLPRQLATLEYQIRELAQEKFERGKLTIAVNYESGPDGAGHYRLNEPAMAAFLKQLRVFGKKHKIPEEVTLEELLLIPDVTRGTGRDSDELALWRSLKKGFAQAFDALNRMRVSEGAKLGADLRKRLMILAKLVKRLEGVAPEAVAAYRVKLTARINELLDGAEMNKQRLEEEVALMADRSDISEELVRLSAHITHMRETLGASDAVGKRLNFLAQELNREANTVGSKSLSIEISQIAIGLKEEIERIREQAQNIE